MVAASPTAQFHRPCVQLASASPRNRNGVSSWACGDVNRQWECTGDFTPHAQAFHRGNVSRANPRLLSRRTTANQSPLATEEFFREGKAPIFRFFVPVVAFCRLFRKEGERIPTEANKGNEEVAKGQ